MALGNVSVLLAVCPFPLSAKKLHLREIKPGFVGVARSCFSTDDLIVAVDYVRSGRDRDHQTRRNVNM